MSKPWPERSRGSFPSEGETASEEVAEPKDPNPAALPENASDGPPWDCRLRCHAESLEEEMEVHWAKLDPRSPQIRQHPRG